MFPLKNLARKELMTVQYQAITLTDVDSSSITSVKRNFAKILIKIQSFYSWKFVWKCCLQK